MLPSKEWKRKELRKIGEGAGQVKISFASYQDGYVIIKLYLILILGVDQTNNP